MKKKAIAMLPMLGMIMQSCVFAAPELPGVPDRVFTEDHTMYYVDLDSDVIPDITGDGYETLTKAVKIYNYGEALTTENTTTIRNTATGRKYRVVFTNTSQEFEVTNAAIDNNGTLSIEGKANKEGILRLFILKPSAADKSVSYKWDDVDEADMTKTVLDVIEFRAVGEGKQVMHTFPTDASSGAYGILLTGDDLKNVYYDPAVYYTSKADLSDALAGFNEIAKRSADTSNAALLVKYITEKGRLLYIDPEYFDKLTEPAKLRACMDMFTPTGYDNVEELQKQLNRSIVTAWSTDGKDPQTVLDAYKDGSVPELYQEYCALKTKNVVNEKIAKASDNAEFEKIFNRMTVVEMINEAPAPAEIDEVMNFGMKYLGFDKSVADRYAGNKNVSARIMLGRPFTDAAEIERIIMSTPMPQSGGGSGGSGGGGGASHAGGMTAGIKAPPSGTSLEPDSEIKPADGFVFRDCDDYGWAKTAIKHLYDNKIINGKEEKLFCPQDAITREEFVKIIVNSFDFLGTSKTVFSDVVQDEWYAAPISTALSVGIIKGISEDEFGIGKDITREDMAAVIYRSVQAANLELDIEIDETAELSDLDEVSDYAREAVDFLIAKGAVKGSDGKFMPKANATRAEAAQMVYQIIKIR